jgi:hypothetical protein
MRWVIMAGMFSTAILGPVPAAAQLVDWTDKGFVNVGAGAQIGGQDLNNSIAFDLFEEQATVSASRRIEGGVFFDAMAGLRLWRNLGAGASVSRRTSKDDATLTSSIPDVIFFDQHRAGTGTVPGMKFSETLFAPLLIGGFPITDIIDAIGFIGPVVRSVGADVVTGAEVTEGSDPNAPIVTPIQQHVSKTFAGFQIGVDFRYLLTPRLGAGGFIRYTSGGGNLAEGVKLDAPGVQIGAGVRYRF